MDDIEKQWREFYAKTKKVIGQFPVLAAQEAVNFFQDRFRDQAWVGDTMQNWKKRKSDKTKRDRGRAILVKSGRLKRSIRKIKADWDAVIVGTSVPYAAVHNEGLKRTVSIKGHVRKVRSRNTTQAVAGNTARRKRVQTSTGIAFVKPHTARMNIPKRQFIGNSPYLDKRIQRVFINKLKSI